MSAVGPAGTSAAKEASGREASGACDLFLNFTPAIVSGAGQGEHKDWIEVMSFSFGTSASISGQAGAEQRAGGANFQDFVFTTRSVTKASPILFGKCATGDHFDKVQIDRTRGGGQGKVETTIILENVLISSYTVGGGVAENWNETVTLNFAKINYKFQAIDARKGEKLGGPVETTYDIRSQEAK